MSGQLHLCPLPVVPPVHVGYKAERVPQQVCLDDMMKRNACRISNPDSSVVQHVLHSLYRMLETKWLKRKKMFK